MRPDLLGWHQELCSESIGLIFCYLPAGFSILVHDQVSDFVGNIEALSVVVVFHRIEHDDRTHVGVQGVGINRRDARFAKHNDHTSAFRQPDDVLDRPWCDTEEVPGFVRYFLW